MQDSKSEDIEFFTTLGFRLDRRAPTGVKKLDIKLKFHLLIKYSCGITRVLTVANLFFTVVSFFTTK